MERRRTSTSSGPGASHRQGVWPLVTAAEMQALDRQTIEGRGIPGELLMESAGRALVEPVLSLLARSARARGDGRPVRAVCGVGNNGGDGFVAVRHLLAEGVAAEAVLVGDPDRLPADAAANWRRLVEREGGPPVCRSVGPDEADFDWAAWLDGHSSGRIAPPTMGAVEAGLAPVADAPGTYVLQR